MNISFIYGGLVHDIQISTTTNKKLTEFNVIMQTYHFSIEQIENLDLSQDTKTCFGCKFSYNQNNGESGGCYTHKGVFRLGLVAKLKRLNKLYTSGKIKPYSKTIENKILKIASNINFLRLGTYGEAVTLPQPLIEQMCQKVNSYTAYTHLWHLEKYQWSSKWFMASTHNIFEVNIARDKKFRVYNAGEKVSNAILCPASTSIAKEKRTTCEKCRLCGGANKIAKDIFNPLH